MNFEQNKTVMGLFIDSTKTYVQLSTAALGGLIAFIEGLQAKGGNSRWLGGSMIAFLLAIGAGALYQYLAVKNIDAMSDEKGKAFMPDCLIKNPGYIYGLMLATFYTGAAVLTFVTVHRLHLFCG